MPDFIHCADIHLGSALTANFPPEKASERRREVRATFGRMADYAADNGFAAVLICGDAFDSDRPLKKDKEYFYSVIRSRPDIDFLYLRGNHDAVEGSEESAPNLKTFSTSWTYYNYGGVTVAGIELCAENARSLYSTLRLDPARTNIVMLHGQIADGDGAGTINLNKLRGRNIDYLALGHVHSFRSGRLDERGVWAYCGCLEGRGFDETGVKGFIAVRAGGGVRSAFVPFASRTVHEVEVDISGCPDWPSAALAAKRASPRSPQDMLKVTLCGEVNFDNSSLAADVSKELEPFFFCVTVRDETRPKIDVAALTADGSLRGAFVRAVLAAEGYSQEDKSRIINAGLKALSGRGDEL